MSIEYAGVSRSVLTNHEIDFIKARLCSIPGYNIVRDNGVEIGVCRVDSENPEDITFILSHAEIYVAFHAATGAEQTSVLEYIGSACNMTGVECDFVEL